MVTENVILKYAKNNPKGCDSKCLIPNTKDPLCLLKIKKAFSIKNLHLWKRGTGNISSESASQAVELTAKSNWLLHFYTFPPKHSKLSTEEVTWRKIRKKIVAQHFFMC